MIVSDIFGAQWLVTRSEPTAIHLELLRGRPHPPTRQGETIILTDDLRQVLEAMRGAPADIGKLLPIGQTAIKRLRRELGHHWRDDRLEWYLDRLDDLGDLTGAEFAKRHNVSEAAASIWRTRLLGPRQRPAGWWRDPAVKDALMCGSARDSAAAVGVAEGSVRRIRWMLLQEASHDPDH